MGRILIIGGSGFLGQALYSELQAYFDVYGTYCTQSGPYDTNQVFRHFDAENDSLTSLLEEVAPSLIISAFTASDQAMYQSHKELVDYISQKPERRLYFLSSHRVFDAKWQYPAYEQDQPLSLSEEGKVKLGLEKMVKTLLPDQWTILRIPWVLGVNSPLIFNLRQASKHQTNYEIYPKLVISVTTRDKIAQQLHYIINQDLHGIFHLASVDLVHHDDLIKEISEKINPVQPVFKRVFQSNEDRYQAILSSENSLPEAYSITVADVIDRCTLQEEIYTLKSG